MKSVLISIRPQWVEKICHKIGEDETGKAIYEKRIEVRKSAPKVPFKAYIYCCKGNNGYEWLYRVDDNGRGKAQSWHGKVIGEFICDGIAEFEGEFHDDGSTEELRRVWYDEDDGERDTELFAENGEQNYLCTSSCLTWNELKKYIGIGYHTFYGWHISDLKIYDKPRELSEFYRMCKEPCKPSKGKILCLTTKSLKMNGCEGKISITRPPQSWMYIEGLREE